MQKQMSSASLVTLLILIISTCVSSLHIPKSESHDVIQEQLSTDTELSRDRRSLFRKPDIKIDVSPTRIEINMPHEHSVKIKCRAKGGTEIEDQPYVSFYRHINGIGDMPMSSGDPGVYVEPVVPTEQDYNEFFGYESGSGEMRSVKIMTLSPDAYETLDEGDNLFYCKVSTLNFESETAYFVVHKIQPKIPPRRKNRPYIFNRGSRTRN